MSFNKFYDRISCYFTIEINRHFIISRVELQCWEPINRYSFDLISNSINLCNNQSRVNRQFFSNSFIDRS